MKRTLGVIASVVVLLILAIGIITWIQLRELPSLNNLARLLPQRTPVTVQAAADAPAADIATAPTPAPTPLTTASPPGASPVFDYLLTRFATPTPAFQVCTFLNGAPIAPVATSTQTFASLLSSKASGETANDPYMEAALIPIARVISLPAVSELMDRVRTARETGDLSYTNSPEFNAVVARASSEIFTSQARLDIQAQRGYHLFVLSRLAYSNPNFAADPRLQSLCSSIESKLTQTPDLAMAVRDVQSEKGLMLQLLAALGVAPEQVGYDANLVNGVVARVSLDNLTVQVPWMQRQFASVFTLAVPKANSAQ